MENEIYDNLEWEISILPIGSSTPDMFFELVYAATTKCPHCGLEITGEASYFSDTEDMADMRLESIYYEECECQEEDDDDEDYDEYIDDFDENLI